jgi:hypothetical protein
MAILALITSPLHRLSIIPTQNINTPLWRNMLPVLSRLLGNSKYTVDHI